MAVKTANVTARIQPEIKEHAEAILEKLGIPVSVFIDMAYRQVIMRDGVPFSLEIPSTLTTRDALSKEEFDTIMQTGLAQAKADDSLAMDDAFNRVKSGDLMCMDKKYEVKVTRQAMAQMKEIVHYISAELLAPEAANKLLDKIRDAIAALSFMPKKYALIEEEPWKHEGVRKIIVKTS